MSCSLVPAKACGARPPIKRFSTSKTGIIFFFIRRNSFRCRIAAEIWLKPACKLTKGEQEKPDGASTRPSRLMQQHEVIVAILLPALFIGFSANRLLLSVPDDLQPICAYTRLGESMLGR